MTTTGLDGNSKKFSLAYVVDEKEYDQEWCFYLGRLVRALDVVVNKSRFIILTDRHKVINMKQSLHL